MSKTPGAAENPLSAELMKGLSIPVYEPFADFLQATDAEKRFELTFLDVARFAGHACLSMTGAFLMTRAAVQVLFPEDGVCVRGALGVDLRGASSVGATGPIGNVIGFITGAWGESGFGGFGGEFKRRHLLRYGATEVPEGAVRFTRLDSGRAIDVFYCPERAEANVERDLEFQVRWRLLVRAMLMAPDQVIEVVEVPRTALQQERQEAL